MTTKHGLGRRLLRDFLLQAIYISIAVILGIWVASLVIQDVLIKQALQGEAEFYWEKHAENPNHILPETRNMASYRDDFGKPVPDELKNLEPGFHPLSEPNEALALISEQDGKRLYQVFDTRRVGALITWFGLIPLATVLAGVYMALYQAYRVSRRAVSPIVNLANRVKELDPANPDLNLFDSNSLPKETDEEIYTLHYAMQDLTQRLANFVKREFDFTRDASHELRSPLTVMKIAVGNLLQRDDIAPPAQKMLKRIESSTQDMQDLTEAFLLLARESNQSLPADWISVNDIVLAEIEQARVLIGDKNVSINHQLECKLSVMAPEQVLSSVIGNLVRNGVSYTDKGIVSVTVRAGGVEIKDSGPGMDEEELKQVFKPFNRGRRERRRGGFGVGLTIVKRLCERFAWPLAVESEPGVGTTVLVRLPDARADKSI